MIKSICVVAAALVWLALASQISPRAQTAQESIERTIGSLVLQNANCSAQSMATQEELRKVKTELAELKAKQPTAEPVK